MFKFFLNYFCLKHIVGSGQTKYQINTGCDFPKSWWLPVLIRSFHVSMWAEILCLPQKYEIHVKNPPAFESKCIFARNLSPLLKRVWWKDIWVLWEDIPAELKDVAFRAPSNCQKLSLEENIILTSVISFSTDLSNGFRKMFGKVLWTYIYILYSIMIVQQVAR